MIDGHDALCSGPGSGRSASRAGARVVASMKAELASTFSPAFMATVAARAEELGLTYLGSEGPRAIPIVMPLEAEPEAAAQLRARIAKRVLSALVKVGDAGLDGALGPVVRASLLDGLSELERAALIGPRARRIVTARADMLIDIEGQPRVVEVNSTIPAMQGYSDIALRAWAETFIERAAGIDVQRARHLADAALTSHGTNADDLLNALVSAYRLDGGEAERPSIALVHRQGDSQLGELEYLAAWFRERGHEAFTVVAENLAMDSAGCLSLGSFAPDLCYRHIFARLVPPSSAFGHALRDSTRFRVYNPIAGHLEQKATLAALSVCAADDDLAARIGLDDEEREVTSRHVPWTRVLDSSLIAQVVRSPARFVMKRSWDFGGKSVVLGAEYQGDWASLVKVRAQEGGWVVQERVSLRSRKHPVAKDGAAEEREVFVDASAYTSFGVSIAASGTVCRASTSPVVNIQSGGGVMPAVTESLLRELQAICESEFRRRGGMI